MILLDSKCQVFAHNIFYAGDTVLSKTGVSHNYAWLLSLRMLRKRPSVF